MSGVRYTRPFRWAESERDRAYPAAIRPTETGGYNEHLTIISDVYEIGTLTHATADQPFKMVVPPPLIYSAGVRKIDGRMRVTFGISNRRSLLHLIDMRVRDAFFIDLRYALYQGDDVRIEVTEA